MYIRLCAWSRNIFRSLKAESANVLLAWKFLIPFLDALSEPDTAPSRSTACRSQHSHKLLTSVLRSSPQRVGQAGGVSAQWSQLNTQHVSASSGKRWLGGICILQNETYLFMGEEGLHRAREAEPCTADTAAPFWADGQCVPTTSFIYRVFTSSSWL